MDIAYQLYFNGYYFGMLLHRHHYTDRPESARDLENSLWPIYQILRLGIHTLTITDRDKNVQTKMSDAASFKSWVSQAYPGFERQLNQISMYRNPHPKSRLED